MNEQAVSDGCEHPTLPGAAGRAMPYCVFTDWLGKEQADCLLSYALDNESRFVPARVGDTQGRVDSSIRRALMLPNLGSFGDMLKRKVLAEQLQLESRLGLIHARTDEVELELVAHGDGHFYGAHIDTSTGIESIKNAQRRLSLVYYFHRQPRRFYGGRLRLLRIGGGPAILIEPIHDTLLVFPSFAPHEG